MGPTAILGWLASLLTGSILLTWLFNESGGSVLLAALFHASIDVAFTSDLATPGVANVTGLPVILWGVAVLVLAGPSRLARAPAARAAG